MKRIVLSAMFLALACGVVPAAEPALLIENPAAVAACAPVPNPCPPQPVCAPEPVCAPTPVCTAPAPAPEVCAPKQPQYVTTQRKMTVDELYVTTEKKTEMVEEERTRTVYKKVPIIVPVTKHEVKFKLVEPCNGKAPRLARGITAKVVPVTKTVKQAQTETYMAQVKKTTEVPVTKTRKVKKWVYDVKAR